MGRAASSHGALLIRFTAMAFAAAMVATLSSEPVCAATTIPAIGPLRETARPARECSEFSLPEFYQPYIDDLRLRRNTQRPPVTYVSSTRGDADLQNGECIEGTDICRRDVSLWGCDCSVIQCLDGETCACVRGAPVCLDRNQICQTPLAAYANCN